MILRHILAGALCSTLMLAAVGCGDDPTGNSDKTPDSPRNLQAIDVNQSSIDLQWTPPADSVGISGYRVWWKPAGGASDSADVAAPATVRRMSGLTPGTTYTFSVASKRGSKISAPATIDWMAVLPPTGLSVVFSAFNVAELQWTAPSGAAGGYLLSWKGSNGDSSSVNVNAGATTAQVTTLMSSVSYTFYLRSRHDARLSSPALAQWTGVTLGAPTGLAASSGDSAVKLSWSAPADTGTIRYIIAWRGTNGSDSGTVMNSEGTTRELKNLVNGTLYEFSVYAVRGNARSPRATITWAPARRFTIEPANATLLTVYEQGSPYGNVLAIDPAVGGPRRLNVSSAPSANSLQLALFVSGPNPSSFEIGPAYAFPSFEGIFGMDSTTFISQSTYAVEGLDSWFLDGPVDKMFPATGNISTYMLPTTNNEGLGQGFLVRTGTTGNYHYARLFIRNIEGELLQGTSPHRFINVEVSYQLAPNVPYARVGTAAPRPVASARRTR